MEIKPVENIKDAFYIQPTKFNDNRGTFSELFNSSKPYPEFQFQNRQLNFSKSKINTLRGIHIAPFSKLITVLHGSAQDVIVDLRPDSPTYLNTASYILSPKNMTQLFIPANCGHGFLSLEDDTTLVYLQDGNYNPNTHKNLIYNDPELNIKWLTNNPILSEQDTNAPNLKNFESQLK
jgi:dTDP-4-dehydrorhamnose 3,5-epimerase